MQRKFCVYYLQDFNAKRAAKRAGYKQEYYGFTLLKKKKIKDELERLRDEMGDLFLNGRDILDLYIRIAFADITDYIEFGNNEIDGSNFVRLKSSKQIDGQLVEEVSVTSGGSGKLKLPDKAKALEKLEKFFDIFGIDAWKRFVEEQRLSVRDGGTGKVINVITGIDREEEDEI